MLQGLSLANDGSFHQGSLLLGEDDVLEIDKEDLIDLQVVGVSLLELLPNALNRSEYVRYFEAELIDKV
jgi:hypothetical protein